MVVKGAKRSYLDYLRTVRLQTNHRRKHRHKAVVHQRSVCYRTSRCPDVPAAILEISPRLLLAHS
jgi:hypothetical protein